VRIAKVLRRFPWMAELIGQGPVGLIGPYSVEAYAGGTGRRRVYRCSAGPTAPRMGDVRRLGLESSRLEPHGGWVREAYRPKGLLAFTARTKEYIRIL